jgi:hypothetical protein
MDFFDNHGLIALFGLAIFPRLTLLLGSFATGGLIWWIGWFIAPHFLVAILSIPYWDSNPILVTIAWIMAFAGTGGERHLTTARSRS